MEIRFDFSELWTQARRIGGARVEIDWAAATQLEPIDIELLRGREVRLEDLDVVNGLLSVDGRQVLLYIPDQFKPLEVVQESPEEGNRFHVADCSTLTNMRENGRFSRYVVTNDLGGIFPISGRNSNGQPAQADSRLLVCRNCLKKLNYQNYCHDTRRNAIWKGFEIGCFFETYSTSFRYLPRSRSSGSSANEYTQDWEEVSANVRSRCGFVCDECSVSLSGHRHLLHVHHINGVRSDNAANNLRALCADCHRRQPLHSRMFLSLASMQTLTRLRRDQGIIADRWEWAIALADLSVHGALLHAKQMGFEVPELGYQIIGPTGSVLAEVELAWPSRRLGVCISKTVECPGWRLISSIEFIEWQ
jgi:hypothetical protein